jgi:hypothetical protein
MNTLTWKDLQEAADSMNPNIHGPRNLKNHQEIHEMFRDRSQEAKTKKIIQEFEKRQQTKYQENQDGKRKRSKL